MASRDEILRDVAALTRILAVDTRLPVDGYTVRFSHSISGDDDTAGLAELARIADALGVEITNSGGKPPRDGCRHFYARREFGAAAYEAFYILQQEMTDYSAFMATRKAWQAAQDIAGVEEVAGDVAASPATAPALSDEVIDGALRDLAAAVDADPGLLADEPAVAATDPGEVEAPKHPCCRHCGFRIYENANGWRHYVDALARCPDGAAVAEPVPAAPDGTV